MDLLCNSTSCQNKFDEAEFILEDKEVLLASPRRMKINPRRGQLSEIKGRTKKSKCIKCSSCALVFNSKQVLMMHLKVCGVNAKQEQVIDNKKGDIIINPYADADLLLLSILNSAQSNEFISLMLENYFNKDLSMNAAQSDLI